MEFFKGRIVDVDFVTDLRVAASADVHYKLPKVRRPHVMNLPQRRGDIGILFRMPRIATFVGSKSIATKYGAKKACLVQLAQKLNKNWSDGAEEGIESTC